jgi:hypothetical protein
MVPQRTTITPKTTRVSWTNGGAVTKEATRSGRHSRSATIIKNALPIVPALHLDVDEEFSAMRDIVTQLREYESRFEKLDAAIHNLHHEFQSTFNNTFDQVMARLDALDDARRDNQVVECNGADHDVIADNPDLLARWPWVDKSLVQDIVNGEFDFSSLPRLRREEGARIRHAALTMEGLPVSPTFEDIMAFLGAWMVYTSIRSSFAPERGPALALWTERLLYHIGFSWPLALEYATAYFENHQNSPAETWYSIDPELVAQHFINPQSTPPPIPATPTAPPSIVLTPTAPSPILFTVTPPAPIPPTSSATTPTATTPVSTTPTAPPTIAARPAAPVFKRKIFPNHVGPIELQICENWNRRISGCKIKESVGRDCPRRHVCLHCEKEGHEQYKCPLKQNPAN